MNQNTAQSLPVPSLEDEQISQAARVQLEKIFTHSLFSETSRMKRFLRYIVEESLEGRSDMIKGYTIGLEVFDRPETFDAQADTIVRVQAGQLRRRLDLYYSGEGANDPVRIVIPKGSYIPRFEIRQSAPAQLSIDAESLDKQKMLQAEVMALDPAVGPGILVVDFDVLSEAPSDKNFALGMMGEIIEALVQFRYLRVVSRTASGGEALPAKSLKQLGVEYETQYALSGSIRRSMDLIRVSIHLIETATAKHVFSHSYDRQFTVDNLLYVQEDIASQVAAQIGAPYGVINRTVNSRITDKVDLDAYEALLRYYAYLNAPDLDSYPQVIEQLEDVSQKYPRYSSVWAALSLMYSFKASQDWRLSDRMQQIEKARAAAKRACAIDGRNASAYHALSAAEFHSGNLPAYRAAAGRAIMLNPNDDNILAFYGTSLACCGELELGLGFAEKALKLNASSPDWYKGPYLVQMLLAGEYESALAAVKVVSESNLLWTVFCRLSCLGHLGRLDEATQTLSVFKDQGVDYKSYLSVSLDIWNFSTELRTDFYAGWAKAGMDLPDFT